MGFVTRSIRGCSGRKPGFANQRPSPDEGRCPRGRPRSSRTDERAPHAGAACGGERMASLKWWEDSEQLRLLNTRLTAIGVSRREFLKVVGAAGGASAVALALAACGGSSSTPTTASSASTSAPTTSTGSGGATPAATTSTAGGATPMASSAATAASSAAASTADLAAEQTFTLNNTYEPSSFDFNKDLYCNGDSSVWGLLGQFDPNMTAQPDIAEKWEANADASVWTFHLRPSKWSNGDPVTAGDYEYSFKRQLDPKTAAPYAGFLYDLKNGQAFNTGKDATGKAVTVTADDVGVKATDDTTLVCTLEGPRGYFPVLATYTAAAPSYKPAVEKFADKWTE